MPRPINERTLGAPIVPRVMKPAGLPARELQEVVLGFDEAEALRLADLDGLYQEAAARSMGVSRQTFGRIIEIARRKVADAILNGKSLRIDGGEITIREKSESPGKIAVASRKGSVDEHFGHCQEFLVFRIRDGRAEFERSLPAPEGCGCKSNIAADLARAGVTHVLTGNVGENARRILASHGISVMPGHSGGAAESVTNFMQDLNLNRK